MPELLNADTSPQMRYDPRIFGFFLLTKPEECDIISLYSILYSLPVTAALQSGHFFVLWTALHHVILQLSNFARCKQFQQQVEHIYTLNRLHLHQFPQVSPVTPHIPQMYDF